MKDDKYRKKLNECFDILKDSKEDLNYLLCVCTATDPGAKDAIGGHAWNIADKKEGDSQPDFATMISGLIVSYLEENGYKYTDKLKFLNALYNELLDYITNGGESDEQ